VDISIHPVCFCLYHNVPTESTIPHEVHGDCPIGLVSKKSEGEFRLIQHLSYPSGSSVNDYIDKNFARVKYASFDDAVHKLLQLGIRALFAKTDIESAFRLIPIHPSDHDLLGFKFQGQYYYDSCLPMGASSSCAIFERFSSALEFIALQKLGIKDVVHILDDFLFLGPVNSQVCQNNLEKFLEMCQKLCVPIKQEKTQNATQVITFMGLELDSVAMEARLPHDKLAKLRLQLNQASKSRKITLKNLQSLLGLLNFCCQVIEPGPCFLRRLIDLTKKVTKLNHQITLNKESRRDLHAWEVFVEHFNGEQILGSQRWRTSDKIHLHTDASVSLGYGAVFASHWFFGPWPFSWATHNITVKELAPIAFALEIWGHRLKNHCIILHTDNEEVVHIINKQTSKVPSIMVLVRLMVLTCMKHNILVRAEHIPGKRNILPDILSRLQITAFRARAAHMDREPTPVPTCEKVGKK